LTRIHPIIQSATAATCGFLLMIPAARAQTLVGIDSLNGTIFSIDPQSADTQVLGVLGPPWNLWTAMTKDSQGRIYAANGVYSTTYGIYEINVGAATATFVCQTDLNAITSLAIGPGDVLYAIHDTTAPISGGPDDLYTINLATGGTTRIGATGLISVSSLSYGLGSLWAWDFYERGLVRIDPATGIASDVNPQVGDAGVGLCQTLCFSDNDVLYGGFGTLAVIDPVTGVPAHIGLIAGGAALITGLEFLPNQPDPFALWVKGKTGGPMAVQIAGALPGANVAILAANGGGGPISVPGGYPCAGLQIDLNGSTRLLGLVHADAQGRASLGPFSVPAGARNLTRLQAVDAAACATSNRIVIKY
jgi:hypothetical protein